MDRIDTEKTNMQHPFLEIWGGADLVQGVVVLHRLFCAQEALWLHVFAFCCLGLNPALDHQAKARWRCAAWQIWVWLVAAFV